MEPLSASFPPHSAIPFSSRHFVGGTPCFIPVVTYLRIFCQRGLGLLLARPFSGCGVPLWVKLSMVLRCLSHPRTLVRPTSSGASAHQTCSSLAWPLRFTTLADRGACPATRGGRLCSCQPDYPDDHMVTFPGCATQCTLSCMACSCIPRPHSQGSILPFPASFQGDLSTPTMCFRAGV